jgi:hypothetical protein
MGIYQYKTVEDGVRNVSYLLSKNEIIRLKKKIKTFKYDGWIPVGFIKPTDRDIIVSDELDGIKGSIYYDGIFYKSGIISNGTFDNVTHWKYFPDKPETIKMKLDCEKCSNYFQNPFDQGYCQLNYNIKTTCKGKDFKWNNL